MSFITLSISLCFYNMTYTKNEASLVAQMVKILPAVQDTQVDPWVKKIPWRREWQSTPVFLPGESHGQRGLADYSPCGHKELNTTEQLTLYYYPLQYSCLENSRNGQWNLAGYSPRGHKVSDTSERLSLS